MYTIIYSIRIFFNKNRLVVSAFSFPSFIFFAALIWPFITGQDNIWDCREDSSQGRILVDCSGQRKVIGVPSNLNPKLQVLNLSGNKVVHLLNGAFDRYKDHMTMLDLSYCLTFDRKFEPGVFSSLSNMVILNMTGTCLQSGKQNKQIPYHPFSKYIQILEYEFCESYRSVNLTDMDSLEELYAKDGRFSMFPIFSTSSPKIRYVDLSHNGLDELRPIDLAPYCALKRLTFKMKSYQGLLNEDRYCECMKVRKWLNYTGVKFNELDCSEPGRMPANCNPEEVDAQAIAARQNCLDHKPSETGSPISGRSLILIIPIVILLLLVGTSVLFLVKKRFKKSDEESQTTETGADGAQEAIVEEEAEVTEAAEEADSE